MRVNIPVSFGFTGDFLVGLSASSSLDEEDMSLGMFTFKNDHKVLKLIVFYLKTHGYFGRTCDSIAWTVTFSYFTSALVLTVVSNTGTVSIFASPKPRKDTQTPTMHLNGLRNVPASIWEAVDSSQEQAEVGKQNKYMENRA